MDPIIFWMLLIGVAFASFLAGRRDGIREFDKQMVEAGLLPPKDSDDRDQNRD